MQYNILQPVTKHLYEFHQISDPIEDLVFADKQRRGDCRKRSTVGGTLGACDPEDTCHVDGGVTIPQA